MYLVNNVLENQIRAVPLLMLLTLAFVIFSFTAKQHCNVLVFVVLCVRARDADVLLYEDRDFCKLYSTNYFENVS